MKAIITAAGMGTRLAPLTNDIPKCLLDINGKSIMQRMLETLRECGVEDIVMVTGYRKETITYPGIKYYENTNYQRNNILKSLFYAEEEMDTAFIFSYSDIIYERDVVDKLLQDKADISIVTDTDWASSYDGRMLHPVEEAELVTVEGSAVVKIGKRVIDFQEAHGEFIGLAKFTQKGASILKAAYAQAVSQYSNRPFHQAASLEKAYLTDMLQELIDAGHSVSNVDIKGGWMEIDTADDLVKARNIYK